MGAKGRVIPDFLDRVIEREVPSGGTVVDLMSGTAVVAAHCADRYRVIANDVQEYSRVIAASLIEHDPATKTSFARSIAHCPDLGAAYERNLRGLRRRFARALEREESLLERYNHEEGSGRWCDDYRQFLEAALSGASDGAGGSSRPNAGQPARLVTSYYANVYYGIAQAMAIDSLRAAIDAIDPASPFAETKKVHYLSALVHAASVATSGTSHFAQPRHLRKDSELRAMAERRQIDVWDTFVEYSGEILATVLATNHRRGNRALAGSYSESVRNGRFEFGAEPDLIYLDPPYTADNYSRFYHVLEELVRYDYPPLARDANGAVLRGRYPELGRRFQSGFCSATEVESEFRRVLEASAAARAKLVISYAAPTGLLLKRYRRESPSEDPVARFETLCREFYADVHTERRPLTHSGQGDAHLEIDELLVVCRRPRG